MKTNKQLGIYIDYTNAFLMELINKKIVSRNIEFELKENDENNHQTHHLQTAYFLEISDIIRNYNQVVLFGPSNSKDELFNLLKFDHNFDHIKIQNINTDKMSELQLHAFVHEYYK